MSAQAHVERLLWAFSARRDHVALGFEGRDLSYAQLRSRALALADELERRGVALGDRVVSIARPGADAVALVVACHVLGAVYVPVNPAYRAREVAHILGDCRPRLLVTDGDPEILTVVEQAAPAEVDRMVLGADGGVAAAGSPRAVVPGSDDAALIIYTSGTTGRSKGAMISYRALVENMLSLTDLWQVGADERLVLSLPLFHVHGLCIGVHGSLLRGATVLLRPRFDPADVVAAFAHEGATMFMGVPTMYRRLLDHLDGNADAAHALHDARLFTAGSAALPAADLEAFERHTGHRILERYGMTETLITLSNPYAGERRPGHVGLPVPGVDARIVDGEGRALPPAEIGELEVRGSSLMTGYFGQPEATRACWRDEWFRTGDVASRDDDGYVRIVGRASVDVIKRAGFKISAREIEEVLLEHPAVAEVAVVGVPDPDLGERIAAAIVAHGEPAAGLADRIVELTRQRLAAFKCPERVVFVDALPRNAMGKLQKHDVRTLFGDA